MSERCIDINVARTVLRQEAWAILGLTSRIDHRFESVVRLVLACNRVVLTGIGKSGIVCQKIAATLSSTGTPAIFVHASDALHGDLGVIQDGDVVIALSNSGETKDVLQFVRSLSHLHVKLIAMTGNMGSPLARKAHAVLDCRVAEEACPMNRVPTSSTTAALALGDALAITLMVAKGVRLEDFAIRHPAGHLGERTRGVGDPAHV